MNFLIFNFILIPQLTERFASASDQNVDQIFYVKFYYLDLGLIIILDLSKKKKRLLFWILCFLVVKVELDASNNMFSFFFFFFVI